MLYTLDVYPLIEYTDPSTGKPSFDGYTTFVVTSGAPLTGSGYVNLSSVPTYNLSASWRAAIAAFTANQTLTFMPVDFISVAVCSPKYHIEAWTVDLINGTTNLGKRQSGTVGNLDPTQLQIAIQDCFNHLPPALPLDVHFDLSIALVSTLFKLTSNDTLTSGSPQSSEILTSAMNQFAIPTSVQAYLDDFPFGNFTPPGSKLLLPAIVLSAQLDFVCATTALYASLSIALFYLFRRPPAQPFNIRNVLNSTQQALIRHPHAQYREQTIVAKVEHIATTARDADDSATETRINQVIGSHSAMIREDSATRDLVLTIDPHPHEVASNQLLQRYEIMRTNRSRKAWVMMPIFGAALVGFGIATWRRPHVVSVLPHGRRATLFSALFTWGIGIWRSLSLVAFSALIRQANSDVSYSVIITDIYA
jgi:hypothetical protein